MSYLKVKKSNITEEELDSILEIFNSDLSDLEKSLKVEQIISYKDLQEYISYRKASRLNVYDKIVRVFNIYEKFKKKGLFKDWYKCDIEELQKRVDNLNIIYKALKSNLSEDEKIKIVFEIFKDKDEFNKKYALLIKFGANDPRLDSVREALNDFDFISNTINSFSDIQIKNVRYRTEVENILKENNYLDNYLYAEYVIKTYLTDDKSYLKNNFLGNLGINYEIFQYCEELIQFLNPVLYKQYQECVSENNKKRAWAIGMTIRNLARGINTGYLDDGTEFDILEFYKRVPFKEYEAKFVCTLEDFILRNIGNENGIYSTINNYLYQNNITKMIPASETKLSETSISYNGVELTPEIIHNVFRYMKVNGLPEVIGVYRIVLSKYVNNEIDFSLLDEQEQQMESKTKYGIYKNPYTLVLKNNSKK